MLYQRVLYQCESQDSVKNKKQTWLYCDWVIHLEPTLLILFVVGAGTFGETFCLHCCHPNLALFVAAVYQKITTLL